MGLSNIIYQIHVGIDGNSWCALLGNNLQEGIAGFGDTLSEALHELAENIQKSLTKNKTKQVNKIRSLPEETTK